MPMLDIFNDDAFSFTSLTDAINNVPFVPGAAGQLVNWNEQGVSTTSIAIEQIDGVLTILNPSPRGGPGSTVGKEKAVLRQLVVPHYQRDDAVYADEVQGVREFGQENQVKTVQGVVNGRMVKHARDFDLTLEYQRVGAIKGIILNGSGSTLYNLFTEFNVSQESTIDFNLDAASPASGVLRKQCAAIVRTMSDNLEMVPFVGVHAYCGNNFFDSLLAHKEVVNSYLNTDMALVLRAGYVYPGSNNKVYGAFEFGGIVWENYRGKVGGSAIIGTDEVRLFPVGAPGLFRTVYAPADYSETVNTIGLPRYAKMIPMRNDKGVELEMQSNALSYCTRPKALMQGTTT